MIENPNDSSSTANIATLKRYDPPNQRNRYLGRRKSGGDRFERAQINVNEGEKIQVAASRYVPYADHGDAGSSNLVNENPTPALISLRGCCNSEAFQLLSDRWTASMNAYNNPSIYLAERPIMYSGGGASAWGHLRLPHQMDFLSELRRAMHDTNASSKT